MSGLALRLVVGLGNPSGEYSATRHNAGYWFIDELPMRHGVRLKPERRYQGAVGRGEIAGVELWLLKPSPYMNRSGVAIRALCEYLRIPSAEVLVAHDELDLEPGVVRLKSGGGAGGHNGLKDAISHVGDAFWRFRLGIGHPGDRSEVIDYVLRRAPAGEETLIRGAVQRAADEFPALLTEGAERVMNRLHRA